MKKLILLAGAAMLAACGDRQANAPQEEEANVAAAETDAAAEAMSLHETTWTFTRDGKAIQESIDATGNYIANAGDEHVDHGTYVAKDGKACFTSAMTEEGEVCWTVQETQVGETVTTTSDKGETLEVTRVEYVPMTM